MKKTKIILKVVLGIVLFILVNIAFLLLSPNYYCIFLNKLLWLPTDKFTHTPKPIDYSGLNKYNNFALEQEFSKLTSGQYYHSYYFKPELMGQSNNSYEFTRQREKLILPYYENIVKRDRDKLIVVTQNGKTMEFKDVNDKEHEVNSLGYSFVDINEDNKCILLDICEYEGGFYKLINIQNGESIDINGNPKWSPSNNRFLLIYMDLVASYTPNTAQIWKIINNKFVKVIRGRFYFSETAPVYSKK